MKKNYSYKWIIQRITALFLVPLTFWFVYQCILFQSFNYHELDLFFKSYFNSFLFLTMMMLMLIHAKLGCETIIQDYVSILYLKNIFKIFVNFLTLISFFLVVVAIIKLTFL